MDFEDTSSEGLGKTPVNYINNSRAEQTLVTELYKKHKREHLPSDFEQKFVVNNDKQFPCYPLDNTRHSDFPMGFHGCLGCGDVNHQFSNYKTRHTLEGRNYFHFQLHCHHPDVFFRNFDENGAFRKKIDGNRATQGRAEGVGRGSNAVVPSWMTKGSDGLSRYRKAENDSAPQYVIRLATYNIRDNNIRRMPITSRNELPHIRFPIGNAISDGSLHNLFDTGAALNTGLLSYHQSLKKIRPELIDSYEEFNGTNPFDPIKLCGALKDTSEYSTATHGILSAVIRYKTPFVVNGRAITIAYALGKDVSVNSILGIPTITELQLEYKFLPCAHITSSVLKRVFQVEYNEAVCSETLTHANIGQAQSNRSSIRNLNASGLTMPVTIADGIDDSLVKFDAEMPTMPPQPSSSVA